MYVSSSVSKRLLMSLFSTTLTIATHFIMASHRHAFPLSSQSCSQTHFPSPSVYSLIATLMTDVLHWLAVTYGVDYTVLLLLVSHAQKGQLELSSRDREQWSLGESIVLRSGCRSYLLMIELVYFWSKTSVSGDLPV